MFGARQKQVRDAAEAAYARVVDQARQPAFFTCCGVPDTLDGRFEMICLHAFLLLHRLKSERPPANRLSQRLFDTMFADLDRSLREIGTGDLSVGRQIKRMAQGFYGRIRAYQDGVDGDDGLLEAALIRNLYGTVAAPSPASLRRMTGYLRTAVIELQRQPAEELLAGRVRFAAPPVPRDAA